jgi:photosystem II stability/assembly factor-like uncharacterized protein
MIPLLLSRSSQRLVATCAGLLAGLLFGAGPAAAANPDSTWVQLALPEPMTQPVFALAVDPTANQALLAGTASGAIWRSADGGQTWKLVHRDAGHAVLTIAFNPYKPGVALAGTRGSGILRSADGGVTWQSQPGTDTAESRAFAFAKTAVEAGTDRGVLVARDSATGWAPLGLGQLSVSSLAVAAVNDPARLIAGADASRAGETLPLYLSPDGGGSWSLVQGISTASTIVAALAAGPLPPKADTRPLLLGTNTALYQSTDNGATWAQLTGGGVLPATDFNTTAFAGTHPDRYYVASDGGGSDRGGLWYSGDAGQHFGSLQPPVPDITALTVSSDEQPIVYVATFRPGDHLVTLFAYHDTGAPPKPLAQALAPVPSAAPNGGPVLVPTSQNWLVALLSGPEAPYLVVGCAAVLVMFLAAFAYLRRGRRRRL